MRTFPEAVAAAHDWAVENGVTVTVTRVSGIDGGDGRIWSSFIVNSTGPEPGAMARDIPEVMGVFRKMTEDFSFTVGVTE